jgi:hypothetical protein
MQGGEDDKTLWAASSPLSRVDAAQHLHRTAFPGTARSLTPSRQGQVQGR